MVGTSGFEMWMIEEHKIAPENIQYVGFLELQNTHLYISLAQNQHLVLLRWVQSPFRHGLHTVSLQKDVADGRNLKENRTSWFHQAAIEAYNMYQMCSILCPLPMMRETSRYYLALDLSQPLDLGRRVPDLLNSWPPDLFASPLSFSHFLTKPDCDAKGEEKKNDSNGSDPRYQPKTAKSNCGRDKRPEEFILESKIIDYNLKLQNTLAAKTLAKSW